MAGIDAELAMASTQPFPSSASNSPVSCGRASIKLETATSDPFPAGLRVLVVDDDPICLLILDRMLRRCLYQVTTCGRATTALEMLRENRDNFDLIISDVCMPDMDGFKLLELVGLEMDLPVIMMSANGETSAVMKGIKHGACDYLLKPVRIEELKNIWQHVVRRKWRISGQAASHDDDKHKRVADDGDYTSSANEELDGMWKQSKKRKDIKEEEDDDADQDTDDTSTTKKPRVVWSVDLHQQFVGAVNQLGIDKAVPKRILELMNVHGLTRENVASHLQKYRLYLKRISGVAHQPGGLNSSFAGTSDLNFGAVGAGGIGGLGDLRTLAATGQLSPQALVSLQAGLLGRLSPPNNLGVGGVDTALLLQIAALQGANNGSLARPSYGQPLLSNQGNLHQSGPSDMKHLTQGSQQRATFGQMAGSLDKGPPGLSALQQQQLTGLGGMGQLVGLNSDQQVNPNTNALMMQALQQQAVRLTNGGGLALPSGGNLGQHGLSAEMGPWVSSPYTVNSMTAGVGPGVSVQNAGLLRSGSTSSLVVPSSSSPNVVGSFGTTSCADHESLQAAGAGNVSLPVPSPIGVSSPLGSIGLDNDLCATRLKDMGGSLGAVSEASRQNLNSFGSNFTPLTEIKHGLGVNIGQRNRAGWQGFCLSQEFGQGNSPVPSPRYSQASSSSLGQSRAPLFGTGFPGNLGMDGCSRGFVAITAAQSDQSTAASDLKLKDPSLGLLMGSRAEHGLRPEHLSDELLNILFKQQQQQQQQQEGLSLTE